MAECFYSLENPCYDPFLRTTTQVLTQGIIYEIAAHRKCIMLEIIKAELELLCVH